MLLGNTNTPKHCTTLTVQRHTGALQRHIRRCAKRQMYKDSTETHEHRRHPGIIQRYTNRVQYSA